jgi:hypothetical protein
LWAEERLAVMLLEQALVKVLGSMLLEERLLVVKWLASL